VPADLRWERAETAALAVQAVLAVVAHAASSRTVYLAALLLFAGVSALAAFGARRRARAIANTATSRVASAAQGYVELLGHAEQLAGTPTLSPYTGLPCVWYRYRIERRDANRKWERVESRCSDQRFRLVDATGACVVDPAGAEVVTSRTQTWIRDDHRYCEELLLAKDRLYALGEFSSSSGATLEREATAEASALLAAWKADRSRLLARFDANRDGEVDLSEWETARRKAWEEVIAGHEDARQQYGPHLMHKPRDGRPYLLSNREPDALAQRSARLAWLHFLLGLGAAAALGWSVS
jgi:hypothetical protein